MDIDKYDLSIEEQEAIEVLRAHGWLIAASPYVEDTFGADEGFEEGRQGLAVCKR